MSKISEIIEELKELKAEYGDLEVVNEDNDYVTLSYSEEDEENEEAIVVS